MAIEILASLLVVVSLVKIIFVLLNAPTWLSLVKRLYARPRLTSLVATSLAGLVLYFLLQSGLTIVHVLAVSVFTALLFVAGLSPLASQILKWFEGKNTAQMLKEQRLYTATWFVLLAWGAYELLAVRYLSSQ